MRAARSPQAAAVRRRGGEGSEGNESTRLLTTRRRREEAKTREASITGTAAAIKSETGTYVCNFWHMVLCDLHYKLFLSPVQVQVTLIVMRSRRMTGNNQSPLQSEKKSYLLISAPLHTHGSTDTVGHLAQDLEKRREKGEKSKSHFKLFFLYILQCLFLLVNWNKV